MPCPLLHPTPRPGIELETKQVPPKVPNHGNQWNDNCGIDTTFAALAESQGRYRRPQSNDELLSQQGGVTFHVCAWLCMVGGFQCR